MREIENLDSRRILIEVLLHLRKNYHTIPVGFRWTELHLEIVIHYVRLITDSNCQFSPLHSAEMLYDKLAKLVVTKLETLALVVCFTQELHQFFMVPMLNKDGWIRKYQAVEVFISFLLQLLCSEIRGIDDPLKEKIGHLEKNLRFLRTVLGDASFLYDEHDQGIDNLLPDFEAVANEAGGLVHSLLFSTDDLLFDKFDDRMDLLKADIIRFINLLPSIISSRATTPRTSALDSLLIVNSLLFDLEVLIKREDDQASDVKDQIIVLHQRLGVLQSSIKDIGAPQRSDIVELKQLMMRIGDMACEAEYLIISFVVGDAPPLYLITRLSLVITKIELMGTQLQEIKNKHDIQILKVAEHCGQVKRCSKVEDITVGLKEKEICILEHLVGGTRNLQIISITGMPGVGKSTFAKKLYNHPSVNYQFDTFSFCVISQSYKKKRVLLDILNNPSEMLDMEEECLVERLYKSLKGRRYLIVMDDIWDSNVWGGLKRCFPDDKNGSRILITSRITHVAPFNAIIYELPPLTNDECWELLEKKVFNGELCSHELLRIGKKIASRCSGLPLAVVAVAGVLSTMDKEICEWAKLEENLVSFISDCGDDTVMQILELSYRHLPQHLKRCFLYLGVFSVRKEIPVQELMRLWIAEGFIIMLEKWKKSAERVAEEYLMELIDRNMVIVSRRRSDGGVRTCVIHDLLNNLCLRKCEDDNFLKFVKQSTNRSVLSKSQRLVDDGSLSIFNYAQNLRSFHAVSFSTIYASNMRLLRVLNFDRQAFAPDYSFGIEFLVCLKYLCTEKLPKSIGNLVNLEYLVVETSLVITSVILKMKKLRFLRVLGGTKYGPDCNTSQTNNLQFLSTIDIECMKDEKMLKTSPHLRKLKCSFKALWDEKKGAYRYPDLSFLTQLESLNMKCLGYGSDDEINFPPNIKKLTLSSLLLPWEKMMKAVGRLPRLEVLKLHCVGNFKETWETRDGEFQQLRFLKMERVHITRWNVSFSQHFPRLERLVLIDCYNLLEIPTEIGEIATLELIEVHKFCRNSLVESVKIIQQEQSEIGNEELRVIFNKLESRNMEFLKYKSDKFSEIIFPGKIKVLALCLSGSTHEKMMEAGRRLPDIILNLVNLELFFAETSLVIPSVISKMKKLRVMHVLEGTKYGPDCNTSQTNNLQFLSTIDIECMKDEKMLKTSPHLRKLKCNFKALWDEEKGAYRYPDLSFLTQLESLKMKCLGYGSHYKINFPLNIRKLTLSSLLPWEKMMKAVGRLPRLEVLKLHCVNFKETWETRDGEFQQLRFLKMKRVHITRWNVSFSQHFPMLERLVSIDCHILLEIPTEIGEIAMLELIEVHKLCQKSLVESDKIIQHKQSEMGNEELRVIFNKLELRNMDLLKYKSDKFSEIIFPGKIKMLTL